MTVTIQGSCNTYQSETIIISTIACPVHSAPDTIPLPLNAVCQVRAAI